MPKKSRKYPWNKGTGGCKKGHDPSLYQKLPGGVYVCLGCKRQNAKKYRLKDPRAYNFKNRIARYGMSIDEYQTIWDAQDGICPICERDIVLETSRIDHDHKTGAVRGILCVSCNSGIGLLHDSPRALIRAAKYVGGCGG